MNAFLFPGFAIAFGLWIYWRDKTITVLMVVTPPFCLLVLLSVLLRWSSPDVRSDGAAIFFYIICGALWLRIAPFLLSLTGISAREDILERQNRSAAWTVLGALAGVTLCFAGANIGKGPGPEVVLFCALLSTGAFFVLWFCFERMLRLSDQITIDRDESVGIRAGAWCGGMGVILGGAVAGLWKSTEATLQDFVHFSWGVIPFLLIGILAEWYPSGRRSGRELGTACAVAAAYLLAAGVYVLWLNRH